MEGVLIQVLVGALLLGCLVSVLCRLTRPRPALCHALWLLVVVKLLVPPVFAWPWHPGELPDTFSFSEGTPYPVLPASSVAEWAPVEPVGQTEAAGPEYFIVVRDSSGTTSLARPVAGASAPAEPLSPEKPAGFNWKTRNVALFAALGIWLGGAVVSAGVHAARMRRFRRAMRSSEPAPGWLVERAAKLAERFGVAAPGMRVAEGLWSAMVWRVIRPVIVVPRRALEEVEQARWEAVVAHELAHLKRRDHWTAWLVLLASCVWWWNPVVWWARRRIGDYAEMACDAWVLWALPERAREYADTLVHFVQAHSATPAVVPDPMPCMSSDRARAFKDRLAAILRGPSPSRLGAVGALCLLSLAGIVLPVFSQETQPAPAPADPLPPVTAQVPDAEPPAPPVAEAKPAPFLPDPQPSAPPAVTEAPPDQPTSPPAMPQPAPIRPHAEQADPYTVGTTSGSLKEALNAEVNIDFTDSHITDLMDFISETYGINIMIDWRVVPPPPLKAATPSPSPGVPAAPDPAAPGAIPSPGFPGIPKDHTEAMEEKSQPNYVTDGLIPYVRLNGVPLREALRAVLRTLNLVVVTYPNVLFVTSQEMAGQDMFRPRPGLPPYPALADVLSAEVSIEFTDSHITELIDFVSETYGLNFMVDWRVVSRPQKAPSATTVSTGAIPWVQMNSIPLGEALDVILRSVKLTFQAEKDYVWVTSFGGGMPGGPDASPGAPGAFPGGPGSANRQVREETKLPYFEVLGIFTPDDGNPIAFIRLPGKDGQPQRNIQVPRGESFDGVRFLDVLPDNKGIEVELLDYPGTTYKVGPPQQLLPTVPSATSRFEASGGSVYDAEGREIGIYGEGGSGGAGGGIASGFGGAMAGGYTGGLPTWSVSRVHAADGGNPIAEVNIRMGRTVRVVQVPLNQTIGGVRFVGVVQHGIPGGIGIEVERVDEPGKREQVPFGQAVPLLILPEMAGDGGIGAGPAAEARDRWWETFDGAEAGGWPAGWIPDGNCENRGACYIDNTTFGPAHGNVLRLMGAGAGWSPIAHVDTGVRPPYRIAFDVFMDGADEDGECVVGVRRGPDWTAEGVLLFSAPINGPARVLERVVNNGDVLPGQTTNKIKLAPGKWYRVVIDLWQDGDSGMFKVTVDDGETVQGPAEVGLGRVSFNEMPYLQLEMRTGRAWFDNIEMRHLTSMP